jgi:hypothetical protein
MPRCANRHTKSKSGRKREQERQSKGERKREKKREKKRERERERTRERETWRHTHTHTHLVPESLAHVVSDAGEKGGLFAVVEFRQVLLMYLPQERKLEDQRTKDD